MTEENVRPDRVFPGRNDPWFIAVMAVVAGGLAAGCVACFVATGPSFPWSWLVLPFVPVFVALAALPIRSNRIELYDDRFVIVYAGTRSAIPYAHVRGVRRTRTLWAGTANNICIVVNNASSASAVTGVAAARTRHLRRLRRALAGVTPRVLQAIHVPSFP